MEPVYNIKDTSSQIPIIQQEQVTNVVDPQAYGLLIDGTTTQYQNFMRLTALFPQFHPATLHGILGICGNDLVLSIDSILHAVQYRNYLEARRNGFPTNTTLNTHSCLPSNLHIIYPNLSVSNIMNNINGLLELHPNTQSIPTTIHVSPASNYEWLQLQNRPYCSNERDLVLTDVRSDQQLCENNVNLTSTIPVTFAVSGTMLNNPYIIKTTNVNVSSISTPTRKQSTNKKVLKRKKLQFCSGKRNKCNTTQHLVISSANQSKMTEKDSCITYTLANIKSSLISSSVNMRPITNASTVSNVKSSGCEFTGDKNIKSE